jgi:hypothetical protein
MRQAFWFGRSSCNDPNGFYCSSAMGETPWLTNEGWFEIIRSIIRSAEDDTKLRKKEILWMYLPDF